MTSTRPVWLFVAALTLVRLSILPGSDLAFDEAHYWMWSERLAPAYFSKGPGVAFAIRAGTALFGANAGWWGVIALNAIPIFNIGAILMTIDPLSIFFWLAAMFAFWIALEK